MSSSLSSKSLWIVLSLAVVGAIGVVGLGLAGQDADTQPAADDEGVLARVGSTSITAEDVEKAMASELNRLDRERHELIENGMERAIEDALLRKESESRGITVDDLLAELFAGVAEPTDEQIAAFYEQQESRINRPLDEVRPQIVAYLQNQERTGVRTALLTDLRSQYPVRRYFEPLRTMVSVGGAPSWGPASAPVTIIEFSDFQCPYCQRLAPTLDKVMEEYGDRVRLVFRQFPLPIHANAQKAAEASLCAQEVDKFWQMHDKMFENIQALSSDDLKASAADLGLDAAAFAECLDSGRYASQVATDLGEGREAGVTGTPAMFINGRFISGAAAYEKLAAVIDDELERATRQ